MTIGEFCAGKSHAVQYRVFCWADRHFTGRQGRHYSGLLTPDEMDAMKAASETAVGTQIKNEKERES